MSVSETTPPPVPKDDSVVPKEKDNKKGQALNEVQQYYNRDVWFVTTNAAKTKIESQTKRLAKISIDLFNITETANEEKEAQKHLMDWFRKLGCRVHHNYIHPTAFKAVYQNSTLTDDSIAPTVGLICEYDAIKGFGHSSGNNLLTEATIATVIGVREAMKSDTRLIGRLVIFGTPASEESGGKIRMMKEGAFDKLDVMVAISPSNQNCVLPKFYCSQKIRLAFYGKTRHIDCLNIVEGQHAVDAAVLCYMNLMSVSNQIKPKSIIHCIIKKGGHVDYLVPKKSELVVCIRGPEFEDLDALNKRVVNCAESAANTTQTKVEIDIIDGDMYCHLNHNKVLAHVFKEQSKQLGIDMSSEPQTNQLIYRSTDLGNVSHKVPLIFPTYNIGNTSDVPPVHTTEFETALQKSETQTNTIRASIAMTFTIIKYLLDPNLQNEVKKQFQSDVEEINRKANKTKNN